MVKKIGIFLGGLLFAGVIYLFFFAAHRADLDKNVHEGIDVSQVSPEVVQFEPGLAWLKERFTNLFCCIKLK